MASVKKNVHSFHFNGSVQVNVKVVTEQNRANRCVIAPNKSKNRTEVLHLNNNRRLKVKTGGVCVWCFSCPDVHREHFFFSIDFLFCCCLFENAI